MIAEREIGWTVTYYNNRLGRRRALTWGLTEDEAMHFAQVAKELGFDQPRAQRADDREDA